MVDAHASEACGLSPWRFDPSPRHKNPNSYLTRACATANSPA